MSRCEHTIAIWKQTMFSGSVCYAKPLLLSDTLNVLKVHIPQGSSISMEKGFGIYCLSGCGESSGKHIGRNTLYACVSGENILASTNMDGLLIVGLEHKSVCSDQLCCKTDMADGVHHKSLLSMETATGSIHIEELLMPSETVLKNPQGYRCFLYLISGIVAHDNEYQGKDAFFVPDQSNEIACSTPREIGAQLIRILYRP